MVSLASLWLPVLVSAVLVFIASSLVHMLLRYHLSDYRRLPSEDQVQEALRPFEIPPGDYMMPCAGGPASMRSPEFQERLRRGPVAIMTVVRSGPPSMGANLVQWFVYCLVVSFFAAYIASRAVGPGAEYLRVFRFAGATAFIGYALALWQDTIWYKRRWTTTLRYTVDGLIYALLTAGTFGWLWPR